LDHDGILDVCARVPFQRGDVDVNGKVDLTDAVVILLHLFQGGSAPACGKAADANDDSKLDIADPIRLFGHLFRGEGPLPEPFGGCGMDLTGDELSCVTLAPCR
jgi:hypothetical protein